MKNLFLFALLLISISIIIICCKKLDYSVSPISQNSKIILENRKHPFSIRNVQKAVNAIIEKQSKLAKISENSIVNSSNKNNAMGTYTGLPNINNYPVYKYFKFDPHNIDTTQLQAIEKDSAITFMDFPFANISIYDDQFAIDSNKVQQLKDGNVYGMALANDPVANNLITATQATILDTLLLPADSDTTLLFEALRQAGEILNYGGGVTLAAPLSGGNIASSNISSNSQIRENFLNICLFKQPHGTVRYQDNNLGGSYEPVRGMQVWALVLGVPVTTYTDANGNYTIPWRFSVGTIMGTKAKNPRVNVKPFDLHGTVARNIYTILAEIIVGSVHVDGWVSSCTLKNNYDFNFSGHTQVRYWSQILNSYYFHDQYCQQEGIYNAPASMTTWACWTNTRFIQNGVPDFGNFGTPLWGHISRNGVLAGWISNNVFDANYNTASNFPSFLQLILNGFLPDIIMNVPQANEPIDYNCRLAQLCFHELGHASMYRQVGDIWHVQLSIDEITTTLRGTPSNAPYGDGTQSDDQRVSIAESWAQFMGTNFAIRRYPSGVMLGTSIPGFNSMTFLRDNEGFFFGLGWIPYELFNDLNDAFTGRAWDRVSGVSIKQMYNSFQPNIATWCGYANNFVQNNSTQFNAADLWLIFSHYNNPVLNNIGCSPTIFYNIAKSGIFVKNNCTSGTGSSVTYTVPNNTYTGLTQLDADTKAQNDVNANGQVFANSQGTCSSSTTSVPISVVPQRVGSVGFWQGGALKVGQSYYTYQASSTTNLFANVPPGTYDINVTQTDNTSRVISINMSYPPYHLSQTGSNVTFSGFVIPNGSFSGSISIQ